MLSNRAGLAFVLFAVLAASPVCASTHSHHATAARTHQSAAAPTHQLAASSAHHATAGTHTRHGSHRAGSQSHRLRGQQSIDSARVSEIQQALIREHYLTGDASGNWDETTKAAMQKYQADQGWQTKLMPDSRALKKLGLGPDYSNAINAKDSSFAPPPPASTIPPAVSAGFSDASGVSH